MKFEIKHEIKGRMRVRMHQKRMTCREADILLFYLSSQRHITGVKVREINCDATINYVGSRQEVIMLYKSLNMKLLEFLRIFLKTQAEN